MTSPPAPAGSKTQPPNSKKQKGKQQSPDPAARGVLREPIPWKPQRGLFRALVAVFVAWVGVMLAMYFTTVRPRQHSAPPPPQSQPGATTTTMPSLAGPSRSPALSPQ